MKVGDYTLARSIYQYYNGMELWIAKESAPTTDSTPTTTDTIPTMTNNTTILQSAVQN